MNKNKLILKNEFEIELESASSVGDMKVKFETWKDALAVFSVLNAENLSEVVIIDANGIVVARYESLIFESETSTPQSGGGILTSLHFREKTDMEKRMDAVEAGQEMQNGAIDDLGAITSALAEAQEGGN